VTFELTSLPRGFRRVLDTAAPDAGPEAFHGGGVEVAGRSLVVLRRAV
jgi:hypothetical protein